MERVLKTILLSLLIVTLHGTINNISATEIVSGDTSISVLQQSVRQYSLESLKSPFSPKVELGSTGFHLSQTITSKLQRSFLGGLLFSLKPIGRILAERESLLFKHKVRVFDISALVSVTHPASEYYVFALRRIVI